jgi:hypothetical protein
MKRPIALTLAGLTTAATLVAVGPSGASAQEVTVSPQRAPGAGGEIPERHVVQSGDTLFDLSSLYFGDSYQWPKLWSYNPQVTNPHWIYPGDILFLKPEAPIRQATEQQRADAAYAAKVGFYFPMAGFWTGSELQTVGQIKYARTGREMLQPFDEVYLEFSDPNSIVPGQEYAINRVVNRVVDDETDALVALEYQVIGRVKVRNKNADTPLVTGDITQLWDVIYRGDVLFVNQPQLLVIEPKTNDVDLEAEIIGTTSSRRILHEQDYIFINAGWDDGVRPGNRFAIWDRQDEGEIIRAALDPDVEYGDIQAELPWQRYGEAMVVYATADYATAVITTAANHEISAGLNVTLRQGY